MLWGVWIFEFESTFEELKSFVDLTFVNSKASWGTRALTHVSLLKNLDICIMNWRWMMLQVFILRALSIMYAWDQRRLLQAYKVILMPSGHSCLWTSFMRRIVILSSLSNLIRLDDSWLLDSLLWSIALSYLVASFCWITHLALETWWLAITLRYWWSHLIARYLLNSSIVWLNFWRVLSRLYIYIRSQWLSLIRKQRQLSLVRKMRQLIWGWWGWRSLRILQASLLHVAQLVLFFGHVRGHGVSISLLSLLLILKWRQPHLYLVFIPCSIVLDRWIYLFLWLLWL